MIAGNFQPGSFEAATVVSAAGVLQKVKHVSRPRHAMISGFSDRFGLLPIMAEFMCKLSGPELSILLAARQAMN
jgi:hypothetical protein